MRSLWGGFVGLVVSVSVAARAEAQVRLTTDKPVYKAGDGSSVKITVRNEGTVPASIGSLNIFRGDQLVFAVLNASPLQAGSTKTWTWNKKTNGGTPVGPGTYRLWVGPNGVGNGPFDLNRFIALTPSGKLAGTSPLPLAVGNEWKYAPRYLSAHTTKISSVVAGWFHAKDLLFQDRWVRLYGMTFPVLWVNSSPSSAGPSLKPLFRFNRSVGYTYPVGLESIGKLKVGSANDTVETPAGRFTGCYRLDVTESLVPNWSYQSFWFAPGVGLVQYSWTYSNGLTEMARLHRATLKGSDGKVYTIGLPN